LAAALLGALGEQMLKGLSMSDAADAAGMSRSAAYRLFDTVKAQVKASAESAA